MHTTPELLRLPRSVLLAIWLDGVGTASVTVPDLLKAVQGDDEPHTVCAPQDFGPTTSGLADLVTAWAGTPRKVTAVLATREDPDQLPPGVIEAIGGADECVLVEVPDGAYVAVPEVTRFGNLYEPGHVVSWDIQEIEPWRELLAVSSLAEAERGMRRSLVAATDALGTMDLGLWTREALSDFFAIRSVRDLRWPLPPYVDGRRRRILIAAIRLRAIVSLVSSSAGGGVDLWSETEPAVTLRAVHRAARLATTAAVLSVAHGGRHARE